MTECIKTGAKVLFEDYNVVLPADLFRIGGYTVLHFNMHLFNHREEDNPLKATYRVHLPFHEGNYYWKKEDGTLIVPTCFLQEINQRKEK